MGTLLEMWEQSIQLPGLYTFDEAQAACPPGYRVPTGEEQEWLLAHTKYSFDEEEKEGIFCFVDGFELRLPAAGHRNVDGSSYDQGAGGYYWSSSVSGMRGRNMSFYGRMVNAYTSNRGNAFSVRCVPIEVEKRPSEGETLDD